MRALPAKGEEMKMTLYATITDIHGETHTLEAESDTESGASALCVLAQEAAEIDFECAQPARDEAGFIRGWIRPGGDYRST